MALYPVNLYIAGRRCVVVGGGSVAARKVDALVKAKACVTVISPELSEALADMVKTGQIEYLSKAYEPGDVTGYFLVICAANQEAVNRQAALEATSAGALVNVADSPELGNFTVPSKVERGDLMLTVSTGGKSPALAKKLREELARCYGPEYGAYLELLSGVRETMKESLPTARDREAFWRQTIDEETLSLVRQGRMKEAEDRIKHAAGCFGCQS